MTQRWKISAATIMLVVVTEIGAQRCRPRRPGYPGTMRSTSVLRKKFADSSHVDEFRARLPFAGVTQHAFAEFGAIFLDQLAGEKNPSGLGCAAEGAEAFQQQSR